MGLRILFLLGLVGCAGAADDDIQVRSSPREGAIELAKKPPPPVASLHLSNGNEINFYDFGVSVLVTEMGAAYTSPSLGGKRLPGSELVRTWKKLAPQTPVPNALTELQNRLVQATVDDSTSNALVSSGVEHRVEAAGIPAASPKQTVQAQTESAASCNNGCCDQNWIKTLSYCQGSGDYSWYLPDYGSTWANSNDITFYYGLVCAATGTSQWSVNIGGKGRNWPVQEGYYMTWNWFAAYNWLTCGGLCGEDMTSSVDSGSNMHLHTYCGGILYD